MECRYQSIFFENMWKYITRRIRDTCERSANQFDRCSTTIVNSGAANYDDEKNASPPCKWLSFRKRCTSYQNDNGANTKKWSFEHLDRTWMDAKPWENPSNEKEISDDNNAGPPCKWLSFRKHCAPYQNDNEASNKKWSFDHPGGTWMATKPWENVSNEQSNNDEKNAGPPCKWLSFRKHNTSNQNENIADGKEWSFNHPGGSFTDAKPWGNASNEQNTNEGNNTSPPCKWLSFRKCRRSYQNDGAKYSKRWSFKHLDRSWMDAITWSGAAVLGWYTSQVIHLKLKHHCRLQEKKCSSVNNLFISILPYITYMNKNDYYISSVSKIEKLISDFTPTVYLMPNDQNGSVKDKDNRSGSTTSADTSEDDLGEVLNSIENRLGLAAIENGQYQDGLSLLRSAAHRNHAPAIYNLGLCYEKGLGVTANEKTAMELYKSAAALDHPEALYNLGIYYGQGRGGLKTDQETAIRLLRLAAVQGQQAAIDALKYLDVSITEPRHDDVNTWRYQHTQFSSSENIVPTQSRLFIDNINYLQARV